MKKAILLTLLSLYASVGIAAVPPSDAERSYSASVNKLKNPGFESGKTSWTASGGTFSIALTGSIPSADGMRSATWDSNAASQTVTSEPLVIVADDGYSGKAMAVSCKFKVPSGTATHKIQLYDGSNVLAEDTITSSTSWQRTSIVGTTPSSGSVYLRVISVASNEPAISIDSCFRGLASEFNLFSQISQAQFIGSITYPPAANCQWDLSQSTYTGADFAADADCGTPTVKGSVSAPGTKVPFAVLSSAAPGHYLVIGRGMFYKANSTNDTAFVRFVEGSNDGGDQALIFPGSGVFGAVGTATGSFDYTSSQTNITFKPQTRQGSASTTVSIRAIETPFTIEIYYFPSQTQTAAKIDTLVQRATAYHDSDCQWTSASAAWTLPSADASCTFVQRTGTNLTLASTGAKTPGVTFTPARTGVFKVCAVATLGASDSSHVFSEIQLWDGTNELTTSHFRQAQGLTSQYSSIGTCGDLTVTSTSPVSVYLRVNSPSTATLVLGDGAGFARSIEWTVEAVTQQVPAPLLVNTVISGSAGVEGLHRLKVAQSCTTNPCTIASQSGSWVTGVSRTAMGSYTVSFASGTFSSAPVCFQRCNNASNLFFADGAGVAVSTSSMDIRCYSSSVALEDAGFDLLCMGPK